MNYTENLWLSNDTPNYLYAWSLFACIIIPFFYMWQGFGEGLKMIETNNISSDTLVKEKSVSEKDEDYLEKMKEKFLKLFSVSDNNMNNSQISPVFYDLTKMSELLQNENNEIETEWKRRIMMKNTHRGNIFMHYNVYKQGFSYYADQQFIPYSVLNGMAMEYVRQFRCLDFFMDEVELPEDKPSRLVSLQQMEEKKEKEEKKKLNKINDLDLKDAPFAKFKPTDISTRPTVKPSLKNILTDTKAKQSEERTKQLALKKRNCFIYGGKIRDMNVWKTDAKDKSSMNFKSELLPKNNMGYAEYKKLLREKRNM